MMTTSTSHLMVVGILLSHVITLTSAWIISPTGGSVAAAAGSDIMKQHPNGEPNLHCMYVEAPAVPSPLQKLPFFFDNMEVKIPSRNIFAPPPPFTPPQPSPSDESSSEDFVASWSHSIQGDSIACTYKPIWDWQMEFFQEHLTNFQELALPDPSLAVVQTNGDDPSGGRSTRVRTKWFSSDEYRLIRMTYMDGGDMTQIFTTVCYPRENLPILGHGLLQVGDRRITISDFQPLDDSHSHYAQEYLQPLKDQYPSLGQEMSERFFQTGEFWSDCTLLGRFPKASEEMWKDLWPAYKTCVQTHVQLCKESTMDANRIPSDGQSSLLEKHAEYDAHVASRDPAIRMLTGIFGVETATKVVYETLFPLADPPQQ